MEQQDHKSGRTTGLWHQQGPIMLKQREEEEEEELIVGKFN